MWNDIETSTDYLHFSVVSQAVADMIIESGERPISVGVSGSWGAGKSSMVKMIGLELQQRDKDKKEVIFLEFNAWLYQGYEDAKTALLHAVSKKLASEMEARKVSKEDGLWKKLKQFTNKINWFQLSKQAIPLLTSLIPGGSVIGGISNIISAIIGGLDIQDNNDEKSPALDSLLETLSPAVKDFLEKEVAKPATEQIEELRNDFQDLLEKLGVNLVVLVDDLDRCLPETAISTLEAMRLLLMVKRTAFIIAADEEMIRNGVRAHFGNVELSEGLVTSYFDKLIQVPIHVPHLGIAEIKVYIVLLYLEAIIRKESLNDKTMEKARIELNKLLMKAWKTDITKEAIEGVFGDNPPKGIEEAITMADQLAGILATADNIKGNPRLIKRFLNALEIRKKVAKNNDMTTDSSLLIKMLLFERCASTAEFEYLSQQVAMAEDGKPSFLIAIEKKLATGNEYKLPDVPWNSEFIKGWMLLAPAIGGIDLRPLLYLSRDKALSIAAYDELSIDGKLLFEALKKVEVGPISQDMVNKIKKIGETEATLLLNHISRHGRGNQWEADTVCAAIHITEAYPSLGKRLAMALGEVSVKTIRPAIIPLIKNKDWAKDLLSSWSDNPDTHKAVKNAITLKK